VTEHSAATGAVASTRRRFLRPPTLVGYLLVFGLGAAAVAPFSADRTGGTSSAAPTFDGTTGTSGTSGTTGTTGTTGTSATGTTGLGATGAGTTGAAAPGTSGTGTTGTRPNTTVTSAGPQRFASDVGVTKDVIKIGYINVDCKTCNTVNIASSAERGNYFKAFAADINARGGINGRKVQAYVTSYDPVADALNGSGGEHRACLELTEKDKIWALPGFSVSETECVAGVHKTPMIGDSGIDDPKDFNRLGGRVWTKGASWRRQLVNWAAQLDAMHLLTGAGTKFSVVYAEAQGGPVETYLLPSLKAHGLTPSRTKNLGDFTQTRANISAEVPAEKAAGITHVVFASGFPDGSSWLDEAKRDQWFPHYLVSDFGGNADEYGASEWEKTGSDFTGAIAISTTSRTTDVQNAATPFGKSCVDAWKRHSGRAVPPGDTTNLISVCVDMAIFERAAKAAGPNPTRASLIQALAHSGSFDDPLVDSGTITFGVPYAFGPVRWSGTDHWQASVFKAPCPRKPDDDNRCWVPIGPVQKMAA
jgi:ABC-type branched-subunit amino acid transport system substrate-binding protein